MDQKCSKGNNNFFAGSTGKRRDYVFTSFQDTEPIFDSDAMRYLMYAEEICPTTGKKHYQGYVYYKSQRSLKSSKKMLGECHHEAVKGTFEENLKYIQEDMNRRMDQKLK